MSTAGRIAEVKQALSAIRKARGPILAASNRSGESVQEILTEVEDALDTAFEDLERALEEIRDEADEG